MSPPRLEPSARRDGFPTQEDLPLGCQALRCTEEDHLGTHGMEQETPKWKPQGNTNMSMGMVSLNGRSRCWRSHTENQFY